MTVVAAADSIRWVVGGIVFGFGVLIALGNWVCLAEAFRSKRYVSVVPLVGSIGMIGGAFLMPPNWFQSYWWVAFIVDFVGVPMLSVGLMDYLFSEQSETQTSEEDDGH